MLKLDFSLNSTEERRAFVDSYIKDKTFTPKELETIADYILYGKDSDGTSIVDRGAVLIKPKHSSYQKKLPESLDSLLDNPTFDENRLSSPTRFKTPKPKIDRNLDADVPGMKELWETIDHFQAIIDKNTGKLDDPSLPTLTPYQLLQYRHMVIEMRQQQFTLRDSVKPAIDFNAILENPHPLPYEIPWDQPDTQFAIAPLGVITSNPTRFTDYLSLIEPDYHYNENALYTLDFRKPDHIYALIENYEGLRVQGTNNIECLSTAICDTLDFYISIAKLTPEKKEILRLKKLKYPNVAIQALLFEKFGTTHSTNYLSTIYKKKACVDIAKAAQLHYDGYLAREDYTQWKVCSCCGELKFADPRVFTRKTSSPDGLNPKCKVCCAQKK